MPVSTSVSYNKIVYYKKNMSKDQISYAFAGKNEVVWIVIIIQ